MIEVKPAAKINATVNVPGSKSITQRALIAAALADGESTLIGPLESEDTRYTAAALEQMGVAVDKGKDKWVVQGNGGLIATPDKEIFLGNNGTATRFLTSVAALGSGTFQINGDERMTERPILPLMQALQGWGVDITSLNNNGCPPLQINARGLSLPSTRFKMAEAALRILNKSKISASLKAKSPICPKAFWLMTVFKVSNFFFRETMEWKSSNST